MQADTSAPGPDPTAEDFAAARAARIARNTHSPGTEDVLRRYLVSASSGQPNYDDMEPALAQRLRAQWPSSEAAIRARGAVKSITFLRVGPAGNDVYDVAYENGSPLSMNGRLRWMVSPLGHGGKVARMDVGEMADPRMDFYYAGPQTLVKLSQRRRLNLLVLGEGSPTVVFASGVGGTTVDWRLVQHRIAAKTRSVAYDGAGLGFSDPGPLPRTASAIVGDLRAALRGVDIGPPYVLVGWSMGGLTSRLFAFRHPDEVVGMVMVDTTTEYIARRAWARVGRSAQAQREQIALVRRKRLHVERMARNGALVPGTPEYDEFVGRPYQGYTPALDAVRIAQLTSHRYLRTMRSQQAHLGSTSSDELVAARRALGDMPLVVLSAAGQSVLPPGLSETEAKAYREEKLAMHDEVAALSTRGERRTVDAGHAILLEKPEVVIAAIDDVLAMAKPAGR